MLQIEDCTDWRRARWEIDNAWLAKDYDLVRKLIEHARSQNLVEASEISVLEVLFEYRKLAGPDLDHEDPGTIFGENFRFSAYECPSEDDSLQFKHEPYSTGERDLTLDAACIGVPINAPDSHSYGHPIEFLWGILDDRLNVKHWWEAREAIKRIDAAQASTEHVTGIARSYLVCLRAQLLEMVGEQIEAARLYETLTDAESPMPVFRVQMLARKKAALLYMKSSQPTDSIRVLDQVCASDPDVPGVWEDLAKAWIAQGNLQKALDIARRAATVREEAGMVPGIGYLLNQTEKVKKTEIEREIKKCNYFAMLTTTSQSTLRTAIENLLNAKSSVDAFGNYAGIAAFAFSKVVEVELREVIFRPWREQVPVQEQKSPLLEQADPCLSRFLRNQGDPSLGEMLRSIRKSNDSAISVLQSLAKFIRRRNPKLLSSNVLNEFEEVRDAGNLMRHSELGSHLAAAIPNKAKLCISAIHPVVFGEDDNA
jgi:tetratricopeptide (TPR) repeat protein